MENSFNEQSTIGRDIADKVIPFLKNKGLDGEFTRIEDFVNSDKVKVDLDTLAGVDYIYKVDNALYGCAFRGQLDTDWRTFTIRRDTEFVKRALSYKLKCLRPQKTIQAYVVDNNQCYISVGIIDTDRLFDFIRLHPNLVTQKQNPKDKVWFHVVKWDDLLNFKYPVEIYRGNYIGGSQCLKK